MGLKKNALTKDVKHEDAEKALSKWFTGAFVLFFCVQIF